MQHVFTSNHVVLPPKNLAAWTHLVWLFPVEDGCRERRLKIGINADWVHTQKQMGCLISGQRTNTRVLHGAASGHRIMGFKGFLKALFIGLHSGFVRSHSEKVVLVLFRSEISVQRGCYRIAEIIFAAADFFQFLSCRYFPIKLS